MKKMTLAILSILLVLGIIGCTRPSSVETPTVDGEKLVRDMWLSWKENNWDKVEKEIAYGFQSVHQDGFRDREEEIELLKGLNLGDYTLSDFNVTQNGNVVVVTYTVSVQETIEGKVLPTAPAPRLTVFVKTDNGWQYIAHANLNPIPEK